ncbi:hypothetical protein QBC35DRAFT_470573 [Podospora australis]|uniref:TPR domain-containing protein n=1 Tax=Podospora australis TaxID=1536484 RepID=A0AAN6X0B4_9PEZI|nr:hypothetical protein QBC35DRAFT_470573 [Podospora australis]
MPIPRAIGLRASGAIRLGTPATLTPRLASIASKKYLRPPSALPSVPSLPQSQLRLKSTIPPRRPGTPGQNGEPGQGPKFGEAPKAKPTLSGVFWQLFKRDMKVGTARLKNAKWSDLKEDGPLLYYSVFVVLGCAAIGIGATVWAYFKYFYSKEFTRYPEPVAQSLRKALYFSNFEPDPQRALKYYKQAIQRADEAGLDPFSDEYMGIKITVAGWLEKIENFKNAIDVLENLLNDCKRWVEVFEKAEKEGTLPPKAGEPPKPVPGEKPEETERKLAEHAAAVEAAAAASGVPAQPFETWRGKRTRVLSKAVSIAIKLARLYSDEHVLEREVAHERLIWAVETGLRETERRMKEGLKEGEGNWLSLEETGAALESLALSYMSKSQYHLAVPLLFQALRLCEEPCHMATLMSNISASFAEHPLLKPGDAPVDNLLEESKLWESAKQQRASYLESAERWAKNAIKHARDPKGDKRTPECDEACVAALTNLGSVLALQNKPIAAREKFERALTLSKELGLDEKYVTEASTALEKLQQ